MADRAVDAAATLLVESRLSDRSFGHLPPVLAPTDGVEAYAIQARGHELLAARGFGEVVGYKIGCTTPVMQAYLGISTPCAGAVLSSGLFSGVGSFRTRGDRRLGAECEIAVRLGRDVASGASRRELIEAVASCHASIEIVEDRYVDYPALDTWTLVADDFFHAGLVLSDPTPGFDPDLLGSVRARMLIDDTEVGSGLGTDVMEHPLDALAWLADNLGARGRRLRAGDVITLGSLVQTHWLEPGQTVQIENDLLGTASAVIGSSTATL